MIRVPTILFGCLTAGVCLGQTQLTLTRVQEAEIIDPDETLQLNLHEYFQNYPSRGPVATFTIDMPELAEGVITEYKGKPTQIPTYTLQGGGTYEDPYAVTADEYVWTQFAVDFQLFADTMPTTVGNFMTYVADGAYENTIVHRNESTGWVFGPSSFGTDFAGFQFQPLPIVQAGGFKLYHNDDYILEYVDTRSEIDFEESVNNTAGTLSMARTQFLDSATSQFFINLEDNTQIFANAYAVYGELVDPDTELPLLADFANAPVYDLSSTYNTGEPNIFPTLPFSSIPNYAPYPLLKSSYSRITSITIPQGDPAGVTYSWEWFDDDDEISDEEEANRAVFDISIDGNVLNISRHDTGYAPITVTGSVGEEQTVEFSFFMEAYSSAALEIFPNSDIKQGGWIFSDWYDWLIADTFPDLYHLDHGYQYMSDTSTSNTFYIYDYGLDTWFLTTYFGYPNMYLYRTDQWVYYLTGSGGDNPRWFFLYDGENSRWVQEDEI